MQWLVDLQINAVCASTPGGNRCRSQPAQGSLRLQGLQRTASRRSRAAVASRESSAAHMLPNPLYAQGWDSPFAAERGAQVRVGCRAQG